MKKVIRVNEKKAVLDTKLDRRLFAAPHKMPNSSVDYASGTDLYLHSTKRGVEVFYTYYWSSWIERQPRIAVINRGEAMDFLSSRVDSYYGVEEEILNEFGLLEETA